MPPEWQSGIAHRAVKIGCTSPLKLTGAGGSVVVVDVVEVLVTVVLVVSSTTVVDVVVTVTTVVDVLVTVVLVVEAG